MSLLPTTIGLIVVLIALSVLEIFYTRRLRRSGRQPSVVVRNGRYFGLGFAALLIVVLLVHR